MNVPQSLQLAFDACKATQPTVDGEICFRWISQEYKDRGVTPQKLQQLAALGALTKTDQNKGGVYYRVTPPRTPGTVWSPA